MLSPAWLFGGGHGGPVCFAFILGCWHQQENLGLATTSLTEAFPLLSYSVQFERLRLMELGAVSCCAVQSPPSPRPRPCGSSWQGQCPPLHACGTQQFPPMLSKPGEQPPGSASPLLSCKVLSTQWVLCSGVALSAALPPTFLYELSDTVYGRWSYEALWLRVEMGPDLHWSPAACKGIGLSPENEGHLLVTSPHSAGSGWNP